MRNAKLSLGLMSFCLIVVFSGCSTAKVVYKDVYVPVRCEVKIPVKPKNDKIFESKKALMVYFLHTEAALKSCVGASSDN